jgi:hypothetical protein
MTAIRKAVIASLNVEKTKRDSSETADAEWYKGLEPKLLKIGAVTLAPSTEAVKSSGLTFPLSALRRRPLRRRVCRLRAVGKFEAVSDAGGRQNLRRRAAQGRRFALSRIAR